MDDIDRQVPKALGTKISLAHHEMLDALVAARESRLAKRRFVIEDAIALLYQTEVTGKPKDTNNLA